MREPYADFGICRCCFLNHICKVSICKTIKQAYAGYMQLTPDMIQQLNALTQRRKIDFELKKSEIANEQLP